MIPQIHDSIDKYVIRFLNTEFHRKHAFVMVANRIGNHFVCLYFSTGLIGFHSKRVIQSKVIHPLDLVTQI